MKEANGGSVIAQVNPRSESKNYWEFLSDLIPNSVEHTEDYGRISRYIRELKATESKLTSWLNANRESVKIAKNTDDLKRKWRHNSVKNRKIQREIRNAEVELCAIAFDFEELQRNIDAAKRRIISCDKTIHRAHKSGLQSIEVASEWKEPRNSKGSWRAKDTIDLLAGYYQYNGYSTELKTVEISRLYKQVTLVLNVR